MREEIGEEREEELVACSNNRKTEAEIGEEAGSMMLASSIGEEGSMMKAAPATADDPSSKQREGKAEVSAEGKKAAASAGGGYDLARTENGKWIMPDEEVQIILNMQSDRVPPELLDLYLQHQAWVRSQYEANDGIVYLDDEQREEHIKIVEEVDAEIRSEFSKLSDLQISDRDSDFFNSDDEAASLQGGDKTVTGANTPYPHHQ